MSSAFSAVREMTKSKIVGFLFNDDDDDNERQIIKFNIRRRRKCYSTAIDVGVVGLIPAAAVVVNECRYLRNNTANLILLITIKIINFCVLFISGFPLLSGAALAVLF